MSAQEHTTKTEDMSDPSASTIESNTDRELLVPLDGSALAEAVLPQALNYARLLSSGLILLRVANAPFMPWLPLGGALQLEPEVIEQMWQAEIDQAGRYLAGVAERLSSSGVPVRFEVAEGVPAEAILDYVEEHPQVMLTAMATHGRSGLRGWVLGSVAEKVVHASVKPLLLVRPGTPESDMQVQLHPIAAQPYRTILVPLDGSAFAEQALAQARDLANLTHARLVLVTVMLGEDDYMSEAVATEPWAIADRNTAEQLGSYLADTAAQLQASGLSVSTQLVHGYPPEEILRVGDQEQADLIVMATHGRGGFQRLWLGSVALKIVQASNIPILVIRPIEDSNAVGVP